jgi:hypothetical protein
MAKIHFEHYGKPIASCGANPPASFKQPEVTKDLKKVTCKTCLKSWSYREAKELLNERA